MQRIVLSANVKESSYSSGLKEVFTEGSSEHLPRLNAVLSLPMEKIGSCQSRAKATILKVIPGQAGTVGSQGYGFADWKHDLSHEARLDCHNEVASHVACHIPGFISTLPCLSPSDWLQRTS